MKLELKHLAPYLPYNITGKSIRGTEFYLGINNNMLGRGIQTRDMSTWLSEGYKPILRPMSEVVSEDYADLKLMDSKYSFDMKDGRDVLLWRLDGVLGVMEDLFKNHFDVFGLIEQGLAIDINSL